jgi:signal recognition particle GTPase
MFDALSNRLGNIFRGLKGRGKITEDNVAEAIKTLGPTDLTVRIVYDAFVRLRGAVELPVDVPRDVT